MKLIFTFLLIINAAAFLIMTADKLLAKAGMVRVPEKALFSLALLGGSAGIWGAMYLWRHKTRHMRFVIGIPVILLCQVGIFLYFLLR